MSMQEPLSKAQALLWIGIGIATGVGASYGLLALHASQTHSQSVSEVQFKQYLDNQREWRTTMRQDIQSIKITQDTTNKLIVDLIRDTHARQNP